MKKIIVLLVACALLFTLIGCTTEDTIDSNLSDASIISGVGSGVVPPQDPVVIPVVQGPITGIWTNEDLDVTWAFLANGQAIVKGSESENFDYIFEYEIRDGQLFIAGDLAYAEIGADYEVNENELVLRNSIGEIVFEKIGSDYFDQYEEMKYPINRLIGTWTSQSGVTTTKYTFNENGTGYFEQTNSAEGSVNYEKIYPQGFVYSIVGDSLNIYANGFRKSFFITIYGTVRLDLKDCQTCMGRIYNKD
jgi:hypothetical protein